MSSQGPNEHASDDTIAADDSIASERSEPKLLTRGQAVGRYVVLDKIGHGGMGVVYAAYDPELNRRVALKLLVPGSSDQSAGGEVRSRLLREAQAMAKLTHPHVVAVYDAGTFEGSVFLAMEFLEGGTLGARMSGRPPWRTLLPLFIDAGLGLAAAHNVGLVHRDFKPDNVLLTVEGVAKVSDFGLARTATAIEAAPTAEWRPAQDALADDITRAGSIVGTPAYMAPEQHLLAPTDARSDQFSFCVALYEALYGERPFRAKSMATLVDAVTSGTLTELTTPSDVPARLRRIVLRGLAVDPEQRWPSMPALLEALQADPSRRRTRRIVAAGIGVSLIAGVGGLAFLDHRRRESCRNEGASLTSAWNDERRETIAAAIRATAVPYAEPTIARIDAVVEPWVARWGDAREAACTAAVDRPDATEHALRRQCLDERRVHLEVVLELLDAADAQIVPVAVQTVAALPRVEPCNDVAWLERQASAAGDADPAVAAQLALDLARVAALTRAARTEPALALARELLPKTEAHPVRRAEVLRLIGLLEEDVTGPAAAIEHLRSAYMLAGRHHADRVAAMAAIELTMLTGVKMGEYATGRDWADHATMMTERDPDAEVRIELLYVVGALETSAEHFDVAIPNFLEQVELATAIYGVDHPETGYAQLALGNVYSSAGRYAEARVEHERARATWEVALGPTHPNVAAAVYNLGILAFREGRYDEAIAVHREALAMRKAVMPAGSSDIAASYSALASSLAQSGNHAEALENHRRAHGLLVARYGEDNPRALAELFNVVEDLLLLQRYDEAEPLIEHHCTHAEGLKSVTSEPWVQCLGQRAWLLGRRGRHAEALANRVAALEAGTALFGAKHPETGTLIHEHGQALLAVGDRARGCDELRRALAVWRESLDEGHPQVRDTLGIIARRCDGSP